MVVRVALLLSLVCFTSAGQEMEFLPSMKLGVQINSDVEEISPLLSPDGKTLWFVRALSPLNVGGKMGGTDIWMSQLGSSGIWLPPVRAGNRWNNRESNAVIGIRNDGRVIYLLNSYKTRSGVAFSTRLKSEWTPPEIVPIPGLEKSTFVGFYMDPAFSTLLISMKKEDQSGAEDLYVSTRDSSGMWSEPINLGPTINTEGYEISPFLSADGKKLYFASNGHHGLGDADIFVSTRLYGSWTVWTKPKNLGRPVNSEKFDAYYSQYGDSVSFFASNREADLADIYQVRLRPRVGTNLKDSINRIVFETQRLLAEISNSATAKNDLEFVIFEGNSIELSLSHQDAIDAFLTRYQTRGIQQIFIVQPASEETSVSLRITNLINYFVARGIQRDLIRTRLSETITSSQVIQIEFQTEN